MLTALIFAAVAANAPAGPPEWPNKGDTVYVSATFTKVSYVPGPLGSAGAQQSDVPACTPMLVQKAKPKSELWAVKDLAGGFQRLKGPWLGRMHREVTECKARLASTGEPWIVAEPFWTYRIVIAPTEPATPADPNVAP